jgi:hypothetical protein
VVSGEHLEAMGEILDACRGEIYPITLLKGISIAEECYPESYLRLMRDLDFLVPKQSLAKITAVLEELGYEQRLGDAPPLYYETHHHAAPFFHEEKNVWVEVHRGLFSPNRRASAAGIFQPDTVRAQSRRSQFQGREVRRLTAELQLIYLAAHWAQDFQRMGGLVAVVDAIYLLKWAGNELCWQWIVDSVRGTIAASYLYLLLTYMDRYHLARIAPEVLHELLINQLSFGTVSIRAAHAIIDRYYVTGKPLGRFSNKSVSMLWETLILPRRAAGRVVGVPLELFLARRSRIQ